MTTVHIRERVASVLLLAVGIFAVFTGLNACHSIGVAHAAPADLVVPDLTPSLDSGLSVLHQYGWIWGGALLLFAFGSWLLKKNESTHMIAQGRTLALLTGALSVGISVANWKLAGADLGGVAISVLMAIKLLMAPSVTAKSGSTIAMLAILLFAVPQTGCTWFKDAGKAGVAAVKDCSTPTARALVGELGPAVDHILVVHADPNGKVDWAPVEDLFKGATVNYLGCVLAEVVAKELAPKPPDPNAPKAAELVLDAQSLRRGFDMIRATRFGGATFKLAGGGTL